MDERKITREDLEAMREEYGLVRPRQDERGRPAVPFNLEDGLRQMELNERHGLTVEHWAQLRGVPVDYARALQRYREQG
jgi:hypothetical protein